ncbi:hypothetical protein Tco_0991089 [Tanacetum coccineum]|uniref:Uncharacterized protein n=1 Tax=Tanacetum coccineum TaxID=301880 RepID=A0ABQ5EYI8_9ASTR
MCPRSIQIIPGLLRARNRHEASIQELTNEVAKLKKYLKISCSSSVSAGYIIEFMLEDLEAVPADYVPAGHVLISADRYRIC